MVTVPLNDNQFAALVSFAFNVGVLNLERSTLLRLLNRGWYEQVPAQMMRWNRAAGEAMGGLTRRRAAEAQLWNSTISVSTGSLGQPPPLARGAPLQGGEGNLPALFAKRN